MATTTINVNVQNALSGNRNPISLMGANLGKQFFTTEVRDCWPNFEKEKNTIQMNDQKTLITNRSPRRYRINAKDIYGIIIDTDINNNPVIKINPHKDGLADATIAISSDMKDYGVVTEEAVKEALKNANDPNSTVTHAFKDPQKLIQFINMLNQSEYESIQTLIDALCKMQQSIKSAMADNTKKVNDYMEQLNSRVDINVHD